jgi:competence protein ComEC
MHPPAVAFWKKMPFIRLLLPLTGGIVLEWYFNFPQILLLSAAAVSIFLICTFFFLSSFSKFRWPWINGLFFTSLFVSSGCLLVWHQDIRHQKNWFGKFNKNNTHLVVTLQEPLIEKARSFKAVAVVNLIQEKDLFIPVVGRIIIYFKKDSSVNDVTYGSRIVLKKKFEEIKNSGNPGGFDYKTYCLFQDITHQVYLQPGEFILLPGKNKTWLKEFLFALREKVLSILRRNIIGTKEQGLAEALLIGYKDDLDKKLVQSYSNTGVVHIIAISGLHLGLIYGLLVMGMKPLRNRKNIKWLPPIIIIISLWLFSMLAGAQPSVLRSAVMFTCIAFAEILYRKASIYNTLAVSAFLLLCYNPFWLWDVGFQLSYAAVLSIVIFMRPVYNWIYIKNKILDSIWKLNAITIAAQIITLPFSLFYFHQFPNFFLVTNFIAVPLSSVILLGEILLCVVSFIPVIAGVTGMILSVLIRIMNGYIEKINSIPFSTWSGMQITVLQVILIMIVIITISQFIFRKEKINFFAGLFAIFFFICIRSFSFIEANRQNKIIVYNITDRQAFEIITGRNCLFFADEVVQTDDFIQNFHIKPCRMFFRIQNSGITRSTADRNYFQYGTKNIVVINNNLNYDSIYKKPVVDLLILSKNPKIFIKTLLKSFEIKMVVFDSSVPAWKIRFWKKDCDSLHISYYDVNEKGAFVMNLR